MDDWECNDNVGLLEGGGWNGGNMEGGNIGDMPNGDANGKVNNGGAANRDGADDVSPIGYGNIADAKPSGSYGFGNVSRVRGDSLSSLVDFGDNNDDVEEEVLLEDGDTIFRSLSLSLLDTLDDRWRLLLLFLVGDLCDSHILDDADEDLPDDEVVVVVAVVLKMGSWNIEPENKPFIPEKYTKFISNT